MNPKKVLIMGIEFDVDFIDAWPTNVTHGVGQCLCAESIIKISTFESSKQNQRSTLLHEIIEAINNVTELNLEHSQICVLEATLFQVLSDNKEVSKYIAGIE